MRAERQPIYRSGACEIDLARRELRAGGVPVPIGGRAFEIIETLVLSAGELVTKEALMERVWSSAAIGDNTLQVHISAVRRALGAYRGLLKTESGRGYRLLGAWAPLEESAPAITGEPALTPAFAAQPSQTNLPVMLNRLVGRSVAAQRLQDLLSAYRIVTLTGPGGIGKSALALQIARATFPMFDGAWLVELASLADPGLVPSAVATDLGLKVGSGAISGETVARAIGGRNILLLLDNCEHVIDAVAELAELIVRLCPQATVLATSREVLRIDGEYVYRVPPLDLPPEGPAEPDDILGASAVELFIARIRALDGSFSSRGENLASIAAICRQLDGIPLAIEFAASRAATLGLSEVAARLGDRFRFLTGGRRTALPRHQTLRATLDWSYELLTEPERLLLRRLAIFSAGFTLEATTALADENSDQSATVDGIAGLMAKSMVALDGSGGVSRWRMLHTIRAYAVEKLVESGEYTVVARRHAAYFQTLLTSSMPGPALELTPEGIARCVSEIDDIRGALDWAFLPVGDSRLGVALTTAAGALWIHLSLMEECRERIERALRALPEVSDPDPRWEMQLYAALGVSIMFTKGLAPEALAASTTALEIAERLGNAEYQLRSLWRLWSYQISQGQCHLALALAERFWNVARELPDRADQLIGERLVGTTEHHLGDQQSARQHLENMLVGYVAPAHRSHIIRFQRDQGLAARGFLARILWLQGFPDQARRAARQAFEEALASDNALSLCPTLAETAYPVAQLTGDLAAATNYVAVLLDYSTRHALVYWRAWGGLYAAELAARTSDAITGARQLQAAVGDLGGVAISSHLIPARGLLAEALGRAGQVGEGLAMIDAALDRCESSEARQPIAELLRIKGELLLLSGETAAVTAEKQFRDAIDWARRQGALAWELRAATSLARHWQNRGRSDAAITLLRPVYDRFTEGFETTDLRAAADLLAALDQPTAR
jgi:predicted ATPase/DNA-binding winged helix-turn-helix (wHTH) protein